MEIGLIVFSVIVVAAGVGYALSANKRDNGISYIKAHSEAFKVKNNGISLDKRTIYSLTLEDLGMTGK